jgi:hypothetical protein
MMKRPRWSHNGYDPPSPDPIKQIFDAMVVRRYKGVYWHEM